jgi:hypothetical protein
VPRPTRPQGRARWRRDERGLSLVELAVAAAVLLTTLAVLGPILSSMVRNTQRITNEARALDDGRRAVRQIERDVRSASCVAGPAPGATATGLTLAGRDGSGAPTPVSYTISGTTLLRTSTVSGVTRSVVLLRDLTGAANGFTRLADGRVTIALTVAVDHGRAARPFGGSAASFAGDSSCSA